MKDFWRDPDFRKRFMGTYGFNSDIEPEFKNEDEEGFYRKLSEIIPTDPKKAIQRLEKRVGPSSSAVLDFTLGTLYFQEGETKTAIKHYEVAVEKFPDFRRAQRNLGVAQVRQGNYSEAVEPLTRTITLGGGDGDTYGLLGFAYLNQERYTSAEVAYKNAMLFSPETSDWKLGLIKSHIAQEHYKVAASLLNELVMQNPDRRRLWRLQANVYLQMNKLNEATVNYEMLRKLGKAEPDDLMLLADIYMTQGWSDLAVPVYLTAVEAGGMDDIDRAFKAAEALTSRGAWDAAKQLFKKIRSVHGEALTEEQELALLKQRAKVVMATGTENEAIKMLEKVLDKNPMDGEALLLAGEYYSQQGQPEKAKLKYESAAKLSDYKADAYVKHAQLLVQNHNYSEAVRLLEKAQEVRPRQNVKDYLESVRKVAQSAGSS